MKQYLMMSIWTMLFVIVVEMIFPSSDLKKYLKIVLGFVMVYMIASPMIKLITSTPLLEAGSLSGYVQFYETQFREGKYTPYEEERKKQEESMLTIYKAQIENQLKSLIETSLPVEVEALSSKATLDGSHFNLESLEIEVALKEEGGLVGIGDKTESLVLDQSALEKEIKKCINNFYNVDNTNIYIIVQDS